MYDKQAVKKYQKKLREIKKSYDEMVPIINELEGDLERLMSNDNKSFGKGAGQDIVILRYKIQKLKNLGGHK